MRHLTFLALARVLEFRPGEVARRVFAVCSYRQPIERDDDRALSLSSLFAFLSSYAARPLCKGFYWEILGEIELQNFILVFV